MAGKSSGSIPQIQADWSQTDSNARDFVKSKPTVFSPPGGTTAQYVRGDGSLAAFPTLFSGVYADLSGKPSFATVATSGAYSDLTGKPTIPAAQVQSDWSAVSGLGVILNKPTIPAAQIHSDWNQVNSAALDFIKNKPSFPARVFSIPTFTTATTATQLSSTREAEVLYEFDASVNIALAGSQTITATLAYADNSGMTTNPVAMDSQTMTSGGVVGLAQTQTLKLSGIVPAGKYRKVTFAVGQTGLTATPTAPSALRSGQEVLL